MKISKISVFQVDLPLEHPYWLSGALPCQAKTGNPDCSPFTWFCLSKGNSESTSGSTLVTPSSPMGKGTVTNLSEVWKAVGAAGRGRSIHRKDLTSVNHLRRRNGLLRP